MFPDYGTPGAPNLDPYYMSPRDEAALDQAADEALEVRRLYAVAHGAYMAALEAIPTTGHTICGDGCIEDVRAIVADMAPYDEADVEDRAEQRFWDREFA